MTASSKMMPEMRGRLRDRSAIKKASHLNSAQRPRVAMTAVKMEAPSSSEEEETTTATMTMMADVANTGNGDCANPDDKMTSSLHQHHRHHAHVQHHQHYHQHHQHHHHHSDRAQQYQPGVWVKTADPFFSPPTSPLSEFLSEDYTSSGSLDEFANTPPITPLLTATCQSSAQISAAADLDSLPTDAEMSPELSPYWSPSESSSPLGVPPLALTPAVLDINSVTRSFSPAALVSSTGEGAYLEAVESLVEAYGESVVTALDRAGFAIVHYAAMSGYERVLSFLSKSGLEGSFHLLDYFGNNALLSAVAQGRSEVVPLLIEAGVNARHRNKEGKNAFRLACDNDDSVTLLVLCSTAPNVDLNERDAEGKSLLHYACASGQAEIVGILMQHSADPQLRDYTGTNPLMAAIMLDHHSFLNLLLQDKSILDSQDRLGRTPLHWAAVIGNFEAVKELVSEGAKLELRDKKGRTPYLLAAFSGRTSIVNYLELKKACTTVEDYQGNIYRPSKR